MARTSAHRYRRTTLVVIFCAAALIGIGLSRMVLFSGLLALLMAGLCLVFAHRRSLLLMVCIMLAGLAIGGWRGGQYVQRLHLYQTYYDQKVTITGIAGTDGTYDKKSQLSFDLKNVRVAEGVVPLTGVIGISGFGENAVFRGDTVQVTGKLREGTGSHQAWLSYAKLHVTKRDNSVIEKVRHRFNAGILTALPEPLGSFGMGLLIGQHSTLPESVYQDLLMVGLVHIIAVSGYNLTIILRAAVRLFGKRSKYQMVLFSASLILLFLLLTGSSASIVRASLVSGLSLLAWYYGRAFKPLTLILLAAAMTAIANPLYVWGDMGWYLSFLAFYGVLVVAPRAGQRFIPERFRNSWLVSMALESLCAELMTLPLILYVFGQMSLMGLTANLIVAVFVPLAMLLSVMAGLAGVFLTPVVGWFAWPAVWVLTYMLDTAHLLASIPHIFLQNLSLPLYGMVMLYAAILLCSIALNSHVSRNPAIISKEIEEHALRLPSYQYAAPDR